VKEVSQVGELGSREPPCLLTVGHSNHRPEEFIRLLERHEIEVVADTRSQPYSRYVSHFNREALQDVLRPAGIDYLFLGAVLGGRPEGDEYYDEAGHVRYYRLAVSPQFLSGIERLEGGIRRYRVAVLCSEENPAGCHRHLLVSRVMARRGTPVNHIRGDGRLQPFAAVSLPDQEQPTLFDLSGESPWKSLRPVRRRNSPPSTSDPFSATECGDGTA
jgi:uncharacterized protein (DUF488 family)